MEPQPDGSLAVYAADSDGTTKLIASDRAMPRSHEVREGSA